MKKLFGLVVVLFLLAGFSTGCYYDNEETLYPSGVCDTVDVRYSNQVNYIISNKCYDCHSNATAPLSGSDVSFEGYANISGYLSAGSGDVNFTHSIDHSVGYTPMPKDQPKLSSCEIGTLIKWVNNGYPDN